MRHKRTKISIFLGVCLAIASLYQSAGAQEDVYQLSYTEIFGPLRRPAIEFDHTAHEAALEDQGCGTCHHSPDEKSGQLVYIEDEEVSCSECHIAKTQDGAPALREAFHGSCTSCHRKMSKRQKSFKGPTTCGECHRPGQPQSR